MGRILARSVILLESVVVSHQSIGKIDEQPLPATD